VENVLKDYVAVSGLLAIMSLGITVKKKYDDLAIRLSVKYNKLWLGAEIILFVLVGAAVDIKYVMAAGILSVAVIFGAVLFRMIGVSLSLIKTDLNRKERLFCMIAYTPKATVQAAIGAIPLSMGLDCGNAVLTVAVLSIFITATLGAIGIDNFYKKLLTQEIR
jgi:NhaP-type Na+/H+ or K+/H+ antiporter